jgi:hypothetical protein
VVDSAVLGAMYGAGTGLIPLGVGYLRKMPRKALGGFLLCLVGGALGGLYAAIAAMAVITMHLLRPDGESGGKSTSGGQPASARDALWIAIAIFWFLLSVGAVMFVSAAYLTPLVLGVPNSASRDALGEIVEPVLLFGGLAAGMLLGLAGVSYISRRHISSATHDKWVAQYHASGVDRSSLLGRLETCSYKLLLPPDRTLHRRS